MRTAGLPAVVAAAVLAGCAGSAVPSSGPELLTEVVESLQDAGSVRIEGNTAYGDPYDVLVQGDAAVGTVGMGADYDAPFVAVHEEAYLLPPDNYWTEAGADDEEAHGLRGRYLTLMGDDWRDDVPGSLADVTERFIPAAAEVTDDIERTEIDGRGVLVLTSGHGAALTVSAEAPYRPLQLVLPADDEAMAEERVLRFQDFGERRSIEAPENPIPPEEWGG